MAAHQKKAARQHAALAWMDESGVFMTPVLRRTWALRGQTPVFSQNLRGREKVSIAGALWVPPERNCLKWHSATLVNSYFDSQAVAVFVQDLLSRVNGRLVLVWDGGPMHQGGPVRELLLAEARRLTLEPLPPYAPELNPLEMIWGWLKYGKLCNFAPATINQLYVEVLRALRNLPGKQPLLRRFLKASPLAICVH